MMNFSFIKFEVSKNDHIIDVTYYVFSGLRLDDIIEKKNMHCYSAICWEF